MHSTHPAEAETSMTAKNNAPLKSVLRDTIQWAGLGFGHELLCLDLLRQNSLHSKAQVSDAILEPSVFLGNGS